jgi:hypothetical protein
MATNRREAKAMERVLAKLAVGPCSCTILTGPERSVLGQLEHDGKITYHEPTGTWRIAAQVALGLRTAERDAELAWGDAQVREGGAS